MPNRKFTRESIAEAERTLIRQQAERGYVRCPNACHGFGRCHLCSGTRWVYRPLEAQRILDAAIKDAAP